MCWVALPLTDLDDYPEGPLVKVVLYHPSLFKIEMDFPNVIYIQEIPCIVSLQSNLPSPVDISSALSPAPDFCQELTRIDLSTTNLEKSSQDLHCVVNSRYQYKRLISSLVFLG